MASRRTNIIVMLFSWFALWTGWLLWSAVVRFPGDPTHGLFPSPTGFPTIRPSMPLLLVVLVWVSLFCLAWLLPAKRMRLGYGTIAAVSALALALAQLLLAGAFALRSMAPLAPLLSAITLGVWGLPGLVTRTVATTDRVIGVSLSPAIVGLLVALLASRTGRLATKAAEA